MAILVTGASGFIGKHLISRLLEKGWEVKVVVRDRSSIQQKNIRIFKGDMSNVHKWSDECFNDTEIVIHLAAEMDFFSKNPEKVYKVNVDGTRILLNRCTQSHIKRFIYASSTVVMGAADAGDETIECIPYPYDYAKSKLMAEKLVSEICPQNKIEYLTLRVTGVYGPGDFYVIYEFMQMVNHGILFFSPGKADKRQSFTYIDDVVEAFVLAIDHGKPNNIYIICADDAPTTKEWVLLISKTLKRSTFLVQYLHIPIPICKVVLNLMAPLMNMGKKKDIYV